MQKPENGETAERTLALGGFGFVASIARIEGNVKALPQGLSGCHKSATDAIFFLFQAVSYTGFHWTGVIMNVWHVAKRAGLCVGVPALLLGAYLAVLQLTGNFHEVVPGQFYRSAQLSKDGFDHYIETYHIRTVINLRGAKPGAPWYEDELAAAKAHGVTHVDFAMSASKELTPAQSFELVNLLRNAEGPILVHCKNGADRTGLASVMYLQQVDNVDEKTAEWQLTPLFGHLNIPFTGAYAMDDTWEDFEKLIGLPS